MKRFYIREGDRVIDKLYSLYMNDITREKMDKHISKINRDNSIIQYLDDDGKFSNYKFDNIDTLIDIYNGDFIYDELSDKYICMDNPDINLIINKVKLELKYYHRDCLIYIENLKCVDNLYFLDNVDIYLSYHQTRLSRILGVDIYHDYAIYPMIIGGELERKFDIDIYNRTISLYKLDVEIIEENKIYVDMYLFIDKLFKNMTFKNNTAYDNENIYLYSSLNNYLYSCVNNEIFDNIYPSRKYIKYDNHSICKMLYHYIKVNNIPLDVSDKIYYVNISDERKSEMLRDLVQ